MIGSLFAGISGLNANATAMSIIGDNIANVNTPAFKSNRASFATVLSQSLEGASGNEIGRGVRFWGASPSWSQGSLENTSNPTDLAVNGKGFFVVQDDSGTNYYTRAGQFNFDRDGFLANPDGLVVQGYEVTAIDPDGTFTLGGIADVNVPGESTSPPLPTSIFTLDVNLDAGTPLGETYTTSLTVFDSLGNIGVHPNCKIDECSYVPNLKRISFQRPKRFGFFLQCPFCVRPGSLIPLSL